MELFNTSALIQCIKETISSEMKIALSDQKILSMEANIEDKLLTKKKMAEELNISLVTLTDWMKKGLPHQRIHSRVYFNKKDVFDSMKKF